MNKETKAHSETDEPFLLPKPNSIAAYPLFQIIDDNFECPKSPKQLTIYEIPVEIASNLNMSWHSRLPKITNPHSAHTVCFGAMFNDRWFACAIWTDPIARMFNNKGYLELRRMAICNEAPKNTASYMIAYMSKQIKIKFKDIVKLISYQDTDVHLGTIYKASNWKPTKANINSSWDRPNIKRYRTENQATGLKIRWEYDL